MDSCDMAFGLGSPEAGNILAMSQKQVAENKANNRHSRQIDISRGPPPETPDLGTVLRGPENEKWANSPTNGDLEVGYKLRRKGRG